MASIIPIPPTGQDVFDANGVMTEPYRRFFMALENLTPQIPPIDGTYLVRRSTPALTNSFDMGSLLTGYLKQTTSGGLATPSTVASIPGTDITGAALTKADDTNVTLTLGGTPTTGLLRAISLTLGWTGLLGLSRGGTNANLSATGGTSRVLRQSTVGGAITVSQLASTDISDLASGTYTPTLFNTTNVTASTAYVCQWSRNGSTVTVSGKVDVDPTAAGATVLGISIPVASNFANNEECGGTAVAPGVAGQCAAMQADAANDRITMNWVAVDTANRAMFFLCMYQVI